MFQHAFAHQTLFKMEVYVSALLQMKFTTLQLVLVSVQACTLVEILVFYLAAVRLR
jgi:hypothetical protein